MDFHLYHGVDRWNRNVPINHWIDRSQLHLAGITPSGLQLGLVFGFMAFAGAESVTALGEESRNAKRIVPKVIFGCLIPVGILHIVMSYCMVSYAHRHSLSLDELDAPFDTIANSLHLPVLGVLSSIGIAMSYFACALGSLNAAARVLFSMAKQQLFFKSFGIAHRANFTPAKSIMAVSLIGLISPSLLLAFNCTLTDCINYLTQLASFGCIAAYFAVCLATPFYLFAKKIPRPSILTIAVISLSVLGFILVFSVIPVPPPPWSFLPYIFLVMVAIGVVLSLFCGRNMGTAGREDVYAGSAAADDVLP
jgi:amino acid transporter